MTRALAAAIALLSTSALAQSITREQAVAIVQKALNDDAYRLEAQLHHPLPENKIPMELLKLDCFPDVPLSEVRYHTVWLVDARLTLKGPGIRGSNYRYLVHAASGKVLARCRT